MPTICGEDGYGPVRKVCPLSDPRLARGVPPPARRYKVLVVDDEVIQTDLMSDILKLKGYEVHAAGSVDEAKGLIAAHGFDALVTDLRMPGADGASLVCWVRQNAPALCGKVVVTTGDVFNPSLMACIDEQKDLKVITKPFDISAFMGALNEVLGA